MTTLNKQLPNLVCTITALLLSSTICSAAEVTACEFKQEANRALQKHHDQYVRPANKQFFEGAREMSSIYIAAGWDGTYPIVEPVLSDSQQAEFQELEFQDTANKFVRMIETRRARDIQFVREAAIFVDTWFSGDRPIRIPMSDEEQWTADIMHTIRLSLSTAEQNLIDYSPSGQCTLSEALKRKASSIYAATRVSQAYFDAIPVYEEMLNRYGDPVELSKIPEGGRKRYLETKEIIEMMFNEIHYASNLFWLGMLEELSVDLNKSYRQDLRTAPTDIDNVGSTWYGWEAEGRYSSDQIELVKYFGVLDNYFPTEFTKGIPTEPN